MLVAFQDAKASFAPTIVAGAFVKSQCRFRISHLVWVYAATSRHNPLHRG
jgi:hypothetical protein